MCIERTLPCCFLALVVAFACPSATADPTAAELLPATTLFYAEIADPTSLVDALRRHPLGKTIAGLPEYDTLIRKNPDYLKAKAGVAIFEFVANRQWHQAIHDLAGGGLYFAVDAKTQGAIVLAHAPDEARLVDLRDRLLAAARSDAKRKRDPDPFVEDEYRGHTIYKANGSVMGTFGKWFVATNSGELGQTVVDNLLDGGKASLASVEQWQLFRKTQSEPRTAWAYLDIEAIRDAELAPALYRDKSDNPGAELLVGGILAVLKSADFATLSIDLKDDALLASLAMPGDLTSIRDTKEYYFGKQGKGAAPVALTPEKQLLAFSLYRDLGEMWRRRSDLFDQNATAELAKADSGLSTVFAGLDFGREVLGGVDPEVQIVATAQSFEESNTRVPQFQLPAAAIVLRLKDPAQMQRQLKVSFQSLIGLTNLGAGQSELPQLELRTDNAHGGQIVSASYENLPQDAEVSNDIIYNFSPSVGFVDDHFIIASTRELALELMALAPGQQPAAPDDGQVVNTSIRIDNQTLRQVLQANRAGLIAQNMLEKGHARKAAEQEIDGLLALHKLLDETTLELGIDKSMLQLNLSIGLAIE